ncbi:MAG: fasciclin domain-containing protein [Rhodothermales bacterium]|nr:fasciclin domain-containing protein [Rhodothermales bacterium]
MKSLIKSIQSGSLVLIAVLFLAACDSDSIEPVATDSIFETAQASGFTTLVAALEAADLDVVLDTQGPFTVFAPTDEAFAKLPAGTVDNLLLPENKAALADILTYHVVEGRVTSEQVVTLTSAKTLQGADVDIEVNDGTVSINGATVTAVDIESENGIIHVVDSVLLPPTE